MANTATPIKSSKQWLFNTVMVWTITTSLFAWLPLVRIIGRPEEYYWGVLGMRGEGTDGPFWIFILATAFVITMLYTNFRSKNRMLAGALLIIWQAFITGVISYAVSSSASTQTIQGQGWHWEFPIWILALPAFTFLVLAIMLVYRQHTSGKTPAITDWNKVNTRYLLASIMLLFVGCILFRIGTNYNWVTAFAILVIIVQWFLMVESFKSKPTKQS